MNECQHTEISVLHLQVFVNKSWRKTASRHWPYFKTLTKYLELIYDILMRNDKKIFMILAEDLPAFEKPNPGTSMSSLRFHLVSLILVDVSSVSGLCLI